MNPSKRALYEMLGNAVRNTAGIPIDKGGRNEQPSQIKERPAPPPPSIPKVSIEVADRAPRSIAIESQNPTSIDVGKRDIAISKPGPKAKPVVTPKMPTADNVARAIVAAARETDEDPFMIESRSGPTLRFRHYAMHALVHFFPGHKRAVYARLVGCPGRPEKFFENSQTWVIGTGGRRPAKWWNEASYDRVIRAIEGA